MISADRNAPCIYQCRQCGQRFEQAVGLGLACPACGSSQMRKLARCP